MSNTIVITDNEANVIEVVTEGPRGPAGLSGLQVYPSASDVASITLEEGVTLPYRRLLPIRGRWWCFVPRICYEGKRG